MKAINAAVCAATLISILAGIAAAQSSPRAGQDGWISMFDGATLTRWPANEHPESWKAVDGAIVGDGTTSHLFWMSASARTVNSAPRLS